MKRQPGTLARMHRCIPLKIGQREGRLPIASVRRAEQREERGVLGNRHQLAVAEGPAFRREVEWKDPDLSNKRVGHRSVLRVECVWLADFAPVALFTSETGRSRTAR